MIVNVYGYIVRVPLIKLSGDAYIAPDVLLSYAITVHKSQGSEWKNIYFSVNCKHNKVFMNKRLMCTAITRPSKSCTVIL